MTANRAARSLQQTWRKQQYLTTGWVAIKGLVYEDIAMNCFYDWQTSGQFRACWWWGESIKERAWLYSGMTQNIKEKMSANTSDIGKKEGRWRGKKVFRRWTKKCLSLDVWGRGLMKTWIRRKREYPINSYLYSPFVMGKTQGVSLSYSSPAAVGKRKEICNIRVHWLSVGCQAVISWLSNYYRIYRTFTENFEKSTTSCWVCSYATMYI